MSKPKATDHAVCTTCKHRHSGRDGHIWDDVSPEPVNEQTPVSHKPANKRVDVSPMPANTVSVSQVNKCRECELLLARIIDLEAELAAGRTPTKRDRTTYMREYMRRKRGEKGAC